MMQGRQLYECSCALLLLLLLRVLMKEALEEEKRLREEAKVRPLGAACSTAHLLCLPLTGLDPSSSKPPLFPSSSKPPLFYSFFRIYLASTMPVFPAPSIALVRTHLMPQILAKTVAKYEMPPSGVLLTAGVEEFVAERQAALDASRAAEAQEIMKKGSGSRWGRGACGKRTLRGRKRDTSRTHALHTFPMVAR